jgi:hypothetical protein
MPEKYSRSPDRAEEFLQRDIFAVIWVVFFIIIIYLTFYAKEYIKSMIIVSVLFLAFILIEPMVRLTHGSKITTMISRGREVPTWKRFPMFLLAILILFALERGLEFVIKETLTIDAINIVLVVFWLLSLFLIYYFLFAHRADEHSDIFSAISNKNSKQKPRRHTKLKKRSL